MFSAFALVYRMRCGCLVDKFMFGSCQQSRQSLQMQLCQIQLAFALAPVTCSVICHRTTSEQLGLSHRRLPSESASSRIDSYISHRCCPAEAPLHRVELPKPPPVAMIR